MFQGDPRIILGQNGARMQFIGGQPLMDRGLENVVLISLFTRRGWCGNKFMSSTIGSDFETECDKPITRQQLNRIREAAELALDGLADEVTVSNPVSHRIHISVKINGATTSLIREGGNWISQGHDPAYRKIKEGHWGESILFEDGRILEDSDNTPLRY